MRYSEKEAFNSCPYKYKLHSEGLEKITDGSEVNDRDFGSAIHEGLQAHYLGKSWEQIKEAILAVYPTSLNPDDEAKTTANAIECVRLYREYFVEQDKNWDVISTEEAGVVSIGGEDHDLHIDLVARNKQSGDIWIWDHKTSGKQASPAYWKGFEISAQLTRYVVYAKEKYGSCAGAIINNIAVGHRTRKYLDNPPGFWAKFERQIFNRSQDQINFWRESDEQWMKQIEFSKMSNNWPKALNKMCAWCSYYELCFASGDEQIKELLYTIKQKEKVA